MANPVNDFTRLAMGFSRIERRHKRFINQSLAAKGVIGIPYPYIIAIKRNPGINQDQLADIQGVDKSRVARIVRNMEIAGYISREPHPEDRRNYMLNLTQEGATLYGLIVQISLEWAERISRDINPSAITDMIRTIDKIIQNLDGSV